MGKIRSIKVNGRMSAVYFFTKELKKLLSLASVSVEQRTRILEKLSLESRHRICSGDA